MYSVVKQTYCVIRPGWPFLKTMTLTIIASALLLLLSVSEANAVWAHHPLCEKEQEAMNARKGDLDKCIGKFESEHKPIDGESAVKGLPERELPCVSDLKALMMAAENLNDCMEKRIWWKPKK